MSGEVSNSPCSSEGAPKEPGRCVMSPSCRKGLSALSMAVVVLVTLLGLVGLGRASLRSDGDA
jgi:hypothetical protein